MGFGFCVRGSVCPLSVSVFCVGFLVLRCSVELRA